MSQFIRSIVILLLSVGLTQGAGAQFYFTGPGFTPDENGTNLDAPQRGKASQNLVAGAVIKDCAECPEMVVIPAGSFVMGSEKNANEQPSHLVRISTFLLGKTEVTQKQWLEVMGSSPSEFAGKCGQECPVEKVSWNNVQEFISKFNSRTGQKYRLPSESEWEYSARAGVTTEWSFGNDSYLLDKYSWFGGNSGGKPHEVGQKLPNAFGLLDMHGNVWEWTQDCWHENYVGAPTDGSAWITSCSGNGRVPRGGSWIGSAPFSRLAYRYGYDPDRPNYTGGFRLARDL